MAELSRGVVFMRGVQDGQDPAWEKRETAEFTDREFGKMPKEFRKSFRQGKHVAHVRRKENGVYEIRCQIDGVRYCASSKVLEEARQKFVAKLASGQDRKEKPAEKTPWAEEYFMLWYETVKRPSWKESSRETMDKKVKKYVIPFLRGRKLEDITAMTVQAHLSGICKEHPEAARLVQAVLSPFFAFALKDGAIKADPMEAVTLPRHEARHGEALTQEEAQRIIRAARDGKDAYAQAFAIALYTGARFAELADMQFKDGFAVIRCAKTKQGTGTSFRRVPICAELAELLRTANLPAAKDAVRVPSTANRNLRRLAPGHHFHELRHTFITRAQECGVPLDVVSVWAGHHTANITAAVYTHFTDGYMKGQAAKLRYF